EALKNRAAVTAVALDDVQARRSVAEARLRSGAGATVQASYGFNATAPEASLAYQNLLEARRFTLSVQVPLWQWGGRHEGVQAVLQGVQGLRGYWAALYRLRRATLFDFASGRPIRE